jgi:hypothetical protein
LVELPLLPRQKRWLSIETIYPGATSPQVTMSFRLRGSLRVEAWVRALGAVVDRHEGLRARFGPGAGGDPVQVIGPCRGLEVERVDLGGLPAAGRVERARELLTERQRVPFDLERGDLVRSSLVRLADDDHLWAMTIHHIAADGASLIVLGRELAALYRAFAAGTEPTLPDPAVRSGDYAVWCAANHRAAGKEEHRRFWVKQLAGVPILDLATDRPRPAAKGAPAAEIRRAFGEELAAEVERLATATRCTRFIVVLAALQIVLGRWSGQRDFCLGLPVAGAERHLDELTDVVAPFNTVLTLRCDLSGDPGFTELLARTRATLLDALMHQELSFVEVVAALEVPLDPGRAQLCQVLYLFDEPADNTLDLPGIGIEDFPLPVGKMPYDLMIHTGLGAAGLWTAFHYDTALFTPDTVATRVRELEQTLRAAAADPSARLVGRSR